MTDLNELLAEHDWDFLIFGGACCMTCTPDEVTEPSQVVTWPCPTLRAAGLTDERAQSVVDDFLRNEIGGPQ
jgi:hypothetical protein